MKRSFSDKYSMRILHRYLGFFLAGIMAVYAISGVVLIFRDTDFLKQEKKYVQQLKPGLSAEAVGKEIKSRNLKFSRTDGDTAFFENGKYNIAGGQVMYFRKQLPAVMEKLTHLHKANTGDPLFYLNTFFGVSLMFFVVSAFWMFRPKTSIFKKGIIWAIAGMVLVILMLFV